MGSVPANYVSQLPQRGSNTYEPERSRITHIQQVAWPSGLRRWFKAPVSSEAWVRIPPLPKVILLADILIVLMPIL